MPVTLAELRGQVQARLAEPISTTTWFTPEVVNSYINDAITQVFLRIVEANPDFFGLKNTQITTIQGVQEYDLPADIFEIRHVGLSLGYPTEVRMTELDYSTRMMYPVKGRPMSFYWVRDYSSATTRIGFVPMPDADGYQIKVWYTPRPRKLVNDADTMDLPDETAQIVVPLATAYALASDKQLAQNEVNEYERKMVQYLSFVTRGRGSGPQYVNYPYPLW